MGDESGGWWVWEGALVIEDSVFLFKSFVAARFDNDNMYEVGVLVVYVQCSTYVNSCRTPSRPTGCPRRSGKETVVCTRRKETVALTGNVCL